LNLDDGSDPDPRFSFANERTFLAWIRTALALIAGGLAITQLLPSFGFTGGRRFLGLPLMAVDAKAVRCQASTVRSGWRPASRSSGPVTSRR